MENNRFKSFNYVVGNDFVYDDKVVVKVFFLHNDINIVKPIDIKKKSNANDSYYIDEARKVINQEINSGKLAKFSKRYIAKKSRGKVLKIATAMLLCGVIAGSSYGTWKYFDIVRQNEILIDKTIHLIESLNEESSIEEIQAVLDAYNALPEELKKSIPQEIKDYLQLQVSLYEYDVSSSTEINNITAEFTIENTTEYEVMTVEAKISDLTHRASKMLREDIPQILRDVKAAIAIDKEKGGTVNELVAALNVDTITYEQTMMIINLVESFSPRAVSYITQASIDKMYEIIVRIEIGDEIAGYLASIAKSYATVGSTCSEDDISELEHYYSLLSDRAKGYADEYGFSDAIVTAKQLLQQDKNAATELVKKANALNPVSCLDDDVNAVKKLYDRSNKRTQTFADEMKFSETIKVCEDAIKADKNKAEAFYNEQTSKLTDTVFQEGIDQVQAAFNNYLKTATERQALYIKSEPYNLLDAINKAQEAYNIDDAAVKNFYDTQVAKLGINCTQNDINDATKALNDFLKDSKINNRQKLLIQSKYYLQPKIDEAQALYNVDLESAKVFDNGVDNLPDKAFTSLTLNEQMFALSTAKYLNGTPDSKHIYLNNRAKTLVNSTKKDKLNRVIAGSEKTLILTYDLTIRETVQSSNPYYSNGVAKYSPTDGIYIEATHRGASIEYNWNDVNVIGDESTYNAILDPTKFKRFYISIISPSNFDPNHYVEFAAELYEAGMWGGPRVPVRIEQPSATYTVSFDIQSSYTRKKYESLHIEFGMNERCNLGRVYRVSPTYSVPK